MSLNDYKREKLENHILTRPDTYIGGCDEISERMVLLEDDKIINRDVVHIPGLLNIYDEILVNARDHMIRLEQQASDNPVTTIKVTIDEKTGLITVFNDGEGIDVADHPTEKDEDGNNINIVYMILFDLLTSKNYSETEKKIVGGKNGYGAKLTNIFSSYFRVETIDEKRGLKYVQESRNNKKDISKAKITKTKQKSYTKISWIADFQRFGITGYNIDMINIMRRRVYDICGVTDKVNVYLDNKKLKVKNFEDYTQLYLEKHQKLIVEKNPRWYICVVVSDDIKDHYSFVNGIMTCKGGKHVDYIMKECTKKLKIQIEKKVKKSINESYIKNYIQLFVNSVIENPSFDSQTKERLITPASKFGSQPIISDKFIKQIIDKTNLIDRVLKYNDFKLTKESKKTDGKKLNKIYDIPKLDDANWAGTKKSEECILILTEGDSAKSMAISGLSVVGRDKYGVFPLKGKVMNVRDAPKEQISKNVEITSLKKIIGLETGKTYTHTKSLRYGKIMIMTDQDHDGSHIKGLVMNVFHVLWPSLLELNYITCMLTPIIKATHKKTNKSFYTITDYEKWKDSNDAKKWNIKYYKGLGTSSSEEAREYFKDIKINNYHMTKTTTESMSLAFDKNYSDSRKKWLYKYDKNMILDHKKKNVSIDDFVNKELIHFSNNDTERSIGSVFDGLKPSQRKILYSCLKRNLYKEIRVAQLAGYVSEKSAYHHGEASLQGAIIAMAQNFVGANNINLLMPNGQFGTRIMGGSDAASPRYIHTELNKIVDTLFPPIDSDLLAHNYDDGVQVEPIYYLPIIPMVLVNGMVGIGTGFSTSVPQFSPRDIIDNIINKLNNKPYTAITPHYNNFTGTILQIDEYNYMSKGVYNIIDEETIEITELPIGRWIDDYKKFLDSLLNDEKKIITDYVNNSSDHRVHFLIKIDKHKLLSLQWSENNNIDGIEKILKLTTTKGLSTSNMHLYDKSHIVKYNDIYEIFDAFIAERRDLYKKRIHYQITNYKNKIDILNYKMRFIEEVINNDIVIFKRNKADIINDLIDMLYPKCNPNNIICNKSGTYDYLLKISLLNFSKEEINRLIDERNKLKNEYDILKSKSVNDIWINELDSLSKYL